MCSSYIHCYYKTEIPARHGIVGHHVVVLVEEVVALDGEAEGLAAPVEGLLDGGVVGVPRLDMVAGDVVDRAVVALADVDEAVVERPGAEVDAADDGAAMPGGVGNLVAVGGHFHAVDFGEVLRPHVGVGQIDVQADARHLGSGGSLGVHASALDLAHVGHHPTEAAARGGGYNLVGDEGVVGVRREGDRAHERTAEGMRPGEAEIELVGELRLQLAVPKLGVVKVVEGGHAEYFLVEEAEGEVPRVPGLVAEEEGGGEFLLVGRLDVVLHALEDKGAEKARLHLELAKVKGSCQCREEGIAAGIGKRCAHATHGAIELVVLVVHGEGQLPAREEGVLVDGGEVEGLLVIRIVVLHLLGHVVLHEEYGVAGEVVGVVPGEFGARLPAVTLAHVGTVHALRHEVLVTLPLAVVEYVLDDGAGQAAVGLEVIELRLPQAVVRGAEEAGLDTEGLDVAAAADGSGVVSHLAGGQEAAVAELVLAVGLHVFAADGHGETLAKPLLQAEGRIDELDAPRLVADEEVGGLAVPEGGALGAHVDGGGGGEVLRRLEDFAFLAVVEGDFLHVVQGEAAEVDDTVLGVADLQAVVEDADMVGTHVAHVDGLQAAHAAVVLDLHAGKVAEGVRHGMGVEAFQLFPGQVLRGNHFAVRLCLDQHFVNVVHLGGVRRFGAHGGTQGSTMTHYGQQGCQQ